MKIGEHVGRCVQAALCQKEKGTEYIGAVLEVTEGPDTGERITASLWWTEATQERTKQDLQYIGWNGELDGDCNLLGVGEKTFPFNVVEEEYQGKLNKKVGWIGKPPAGISAKERLTMAQAKNFASRLRGSFGKAKDGDIPF